MRLSKLKLFFIAGLVFSISSSAQVFNSKFDTKNHPKAKNVWATIKYPTGWEAREGERPNIIQKFSGDYKSFYTILSLQILNTSEPVEAHCKAVSAKGIEGIFSDPASSQFATNAKKIMHENKPAFIYDLEHRVERAGFSLITNHRVMTVCHQKTMLSAWCSPSKMDYVSKQFSSNKNDLNEITSLCFQFFNSLVLMDSY
jgi:hypothetical protein